MATMVERLFEILPPEGSIDELGLVIDAIRDVYDLEHVAYLAVSLGAEFHVASRQPGLGALKKSAGHWARDESGVLTTATYTAEWVNHYVDSGYKRIDPVIESALTSFVPLDWRKLPWDSKKRRAMLREAVDTGLGNQGYTIPIRGPDGQFAIFSINKTCGDDAWEKFIAEKNSEFLIIAHFFHQKVLQIEKHLVSRPTRSCRTENAMH